MAAFLYLPCGRIEHNIPVALLTHRSKAEKLAFKFKELIVDFFKTKKSTECSFAANGSIKMSIRAS